MTGVLCLLAGTLTFASDDFVDDAKIKSDFESKLNALFQAGGAPKASETLRQLREERSGPVSLAPVADPPESDSHDLARSATLVFGHLYLCNKCSHYHGNFSGGVIISPDGLALTNFHVLDFRDAIVFGAMTADGHMYLIDEVIASSKADDYALVRLRDAANLPAVPLQPDVAQGDELFVISHPDGYFYSLTKGTLSRKYLTPKERVPRLQITADFARGSSGSGIFNLKGQLIGLVTTTNSIYYSKEEDHPENLQMVIHSAVPISSVMKLFTPSL
jgi:serine protease Do